MSGSTSDRQLDRLVKAGWLKIGLSQDDLAEVLDAVLRPLVRDDGEAGHIGVDRLAEIGHAIGIPLDIFRPKGPGTEQPRTEQPRTEQSRTEQPGTEQPALYPVDLSLSLLELRLLRAFCQLRDHRTKRLLIHLAEQLVKRQTDHGGDAA